MELLLKIILLFAFGFGMGFMVFDFIFSKREKKLKLEKEELISEIEKTNGDIKHLKERLSIHTYYFAADAREYKIIENYDSFEVVLKIVTIPPYREENIPIKRFYFKNDIEHAKSCAQKLLDALNSTN
jgi:type III secretory pathway component EscU